MIYRNLVEKTQISATGSPWTANSYIDFSEKMPVLALSELYVTMYGDNVTDEALVSELVNELLNTLYFKSASLGVLHDIRGDDLVALLALMLGIPDPYVTGANVDNAERSITVLIPFSRFRFDNLVGCPPLAKGDWTAKIQLGTSSHVDGADYEVNAVLDIAKAPRYVLTTQTISKTPPVGATKIELPSGIFIQSSTPSKLSAFFIFPLVQTAP